MFGCTKVLRNWSAEMKANTPTHVNVYDVADPELNIAGRGLDPDGMILVALMSGGDYLPDGIARCGIKLACEAAKAGYGKSLCLLQSHDREGLHEWRESLRHELQTNENGYFRTRHHSLKIPDDFPDLEVLRYYTNPAVSPSESLEAVRDAMTMRRRVQVNRLRSFVRDNFEWQGKEGANKLIRTLSQPLLVDVLVDKILHTGQAIGEASAGTLIRKITGRRTAFMNDATPELRISYVPREVVPIDVSQEAQADEPTSQDYRVSLERDSESEERPGELVTTSEQPTKPVRRVYDSSKPELAWVLEGLVKKVQPAALAAFDELELAKMTRKPQQKPKTPSARSKRGTGMPRGAIDRFVRVSKPAAASRKVCQDELGDAASCKAPGASSGPRTGLSTRHQSKPSQPLGSPSKAGTCGTTASSQVTTRTANTPGGFEANVTSSSLPPPPTSPAPSSSPNSSPPRQPLAANPVVHCEKLPRPARPFLATGAAEARLTRPKPTSTTPIVIAVQDSPPRPFEGSVMKQKTLDATAMRLSPPAVGGLASSPSKHAKAHSAKQLGIEVQQAGRDDSISGLEAASLLSSSSLLGRKAPQQSHERKDDQTTPSDASSLLTPERKVMKKLFVLDSSADGFAEVVDVESEERDVLEELDMARRDQKHGRARMVRLSDVSVVDLTADSP